VAPGTTGNAPAPATSASTEPPPVLTLDTSVALALSIGTPVQQARFGSANARTEVVRSYSGILPSLTAAGARTVTAGDPLVGSRATAPWNTQFETMGYQLQTSLNLLAAVSAYPGIRSAESMRQTLDLTLERTRQSVALDVSQAFLQTVLDSELVVIAAQNVAVSQEQVVQLQELVRVGKRPPADMYQAQAQASANQSTFFDAVNRERADEISLLQRVHIDPQRTVAFAAPVLDTTRVGPQYLDTNRVVADAVRRRPDLQSAYAAIDATRWGLRRAANENMPQLSLGFALFSTGRVFDYANQAGVPQITSPQTPLGTQVGNQATHIISIGLGYSLFDLFRSRLDVQEARVAYGSAQLAEGDMQRAVTGDVARAISEYGVAEQRMVSTASGLTAAQAAFELVTGRYNVGFASIVDLLTSQAALAQAQSLRAQAIIQISLAKRALAYAMGFQPTDRLL
jgi:outer membrane protein